MPYLIDGHNLIPRLPNLNLSEVDDEMQLVELLQEFCQHSRKRVEVYFDQAPPGSLRVRTFGMVKAHFVRQGRTADEEIGARLMRLGGEARNWTVVSSDHKVQSYARSYKAQVQSSSEFSRFLMNTLALNKDNKETADQHSAVSPDEVREWLDLFETRRDNNDG